MGEVDYDILESRIYDCISELKFPYSLREYQHIAIKHMYFYTNLLVSLSTSYGKTVIFLASILLLRLKEKKPSGCGVIIEPLEMICCNQKSITSTISGSKIAFLSL
jgi:superfamily II DNA or RNA helicase